MKATAVALHAALALWLLCGPAPGESYVVASLRDYDGTVSNLVVTAPEYRVLQQVLTAGNRVLPQAYERLRKAWAEEQDVAEDGTSVSIHAFPMRRPGTRLLTTVATTSDKAVAGQKKEEYDRAAADRFRDAAREEDKLRSAMTSTERDALEARAEVHAELLRRLRDEVEAVLEEQANGEEEPSAKTVFGGRDGSGGSGGNRRITVKKGRKLGDPYDQGITKSGGSLIKKH